MLDIKHSAGKKETFHSTREVTCSMKALFSSPGDKSFAISTHTKAYPDGFSQSPNSKHFLREFQDFSFFFPKCRLA